MSQKLSKREALNEVAKVLEAALAEYESLEKMDFEGGEESEEEKRAKEEAAAEAAASEGQEAPADEPSDEEQAAEGAQDEQSEGEEAPAEEEEEEEEMNDETLKSEYAKLTKKMSERGLMKSETVKKSESNDLKKYETQISDLTKTVTDLQASIKKIANAPVSKGVKGYNPLKKNTEEEAAPLNKSEVINKILNLKKSGQSVPVGIINRIEGNRCSNEDATYIKGLIG